MHALLAFGRRILAFSRKILTFGIITKWPYLLLTIAILYILYRYRYTIKIITIYLKSRLVKKVVFETKYRYVRIIYDDKKSITLPYYSRKVPGMLGCQYFTLKDGVKNPLYHPPGIPFFVNADMLEVDAIVIHNDEGEVKEYRGNVVPQI